MQSHQIVTNIQGHLTVYGGGRIGEKASNLLKFADKIRLAGFHINPQTILAEYLTNRIINSIHNEEIQDREVLQILQKIKSQFTTPIIVRSAAIEGDALGVGIYESVATTADSLEYAVIKVAESYNSERAIEYRSKTNVDSGFSIIIEPLVGDYSEDRSFYHPLIAGSGFSNTNDGSSLVVAHGYGDQAVLGNNCIRITNDNVLDWSKRLEDPRKVSKSRSKRIFSLNSRSLDYKYWLEAVSNFDLKPYLDKLKLLQNGDIPVYIEYVIDKDQRLFITQIAEDPKLNHPDALKIIQNNPSGGLINLSGDVVGSNVINANTIIMFKDDEDYGNRDILITINESKEPYILLIDTNIFTIRENCDFPESIFSNAQAVILIEIKSFRPIHNERATTHLSQQYRQTGRVDASCLTDELSKDMLHKWQQMRTCEIIKGDFTLAAVEGTQHSGRLVLLDNTN